MLWLTLAQAAGISSLPPPPLLKDGHPCAGADVELLATLSRKRPTSLHPLIVGAGEGGTGTRSLADALQLLKLGRVCHYAHPPCDSELLTMDYAKVAASYDFRKLSAFSAALDTPIPQYLPLILATFPRAVVILTERDPFSWVESRRKHKRDVPSPMAAIYGSIRSSETLSLRQNSTTAALPAAIAYHIYNTYVRCIVPPERLLVLNVFKMCSRDMWAALTSFLHHHRLGNFSQSQAVRSGAFPGSRDGSCLATCQGGACPSPSTRPLLPSPHNAPPAPPPPQLLGSLESAPSPSSKAIIFVQVERNEIPIAFFHFMLGEFLPVVAEVARAARNTSSVELHLYHNNHKGAGTVATGGFFRFYGDIEGPWLRIKRESKPKDGHVYIKIKPGSPGGLDYRPFTPDFLEPLRAAVAWLKLQATRWELSRMSRIQFRADLLIQVNPGKMKKCK